MDNELIENYNKYTERFLLFKRFGYDIEKERQVIIEKALPLNGKILEIGTGKGYLTLQLAQNGYKFVSIDISKEEQRFAKMRLRYLGLENYVTFLVSDAGNTDFSDGEFDVIFSVNLTHHLSQPFNVIDEMIRILSPSGKIVLSDFSEKGFALVDNIHKSEGRVHTRSPYALNEIADYLLKRNFKIEEYRGIFQDTFIATNKQIR